MVFSSLSFIYFFLPITIIGYIMIAPKFKNAFLLFMSLIFYAYGEPQFVIVLIFSVVLNWAFALLIDKLKGKRRGFAKVVLVVDIIGNLGLLFVYKYLAFVVNNIALFCDRAVVPIQLMDFVMPIGISFFTFQSLSYVLDIYRDTEVRAEKNVLNVGLYILFFPQLIAGPIVRYGSIREQISVRALSWEQFTYGMMRFVKGLSKKVILANNLAVISDKAFGLPDDELSVAFAWIGAIAYTLQIYFDFSGYSDMAIGLGAMFGFKFDENFNFPYMAQSITDFWRRWHISLGAWFKDYVYFPLGGSRVKGKIRHIFNLLVVCLLTGLWHGARWSFVAWGFMYFVLLVLEKYLVHPEKIKSMKMKQGWRLMTLLFIVLGWTLFRSEGLKNAMQYLRAMFCIDHKVIIDGNAKFFLREYIVIFITSIVLSTNLVSKWIVAMKKKMNGVLIEVMRMVVYGGLLIVCTSYLVLDMHNPFIYFNF